MPSSGYFDAVDALSPAVHWTHGDASGTSAVDRTGNGHTGTYSEVDAEGFTLGQPSLIPGEPSETCVQYNSDADSTSGGYCYVADAAWLAHSPNANEFTAIVTYQPESFGAQRDIIGKLDEWQLWQETSGKITLYVTPAWQSQISTAALTIDTPHFICLRQDGTNMEIFINGSSDASKAKATNLTDSATHLRTGGSSSPGSGRFNVGSQQGFAYWPGSYLTDQNITDLYNLWNTVPSSGSTTGLRKDPSSGLYLPPTPYFTRRWRR